MFCCVRATIKALFMKRDRKNNNAWPLSAAKLWQLHYFFQFRLVLLMSHKLYTSPTTLVTHLSLSDIMCTLHTSKKTNKQKHYFRKEPGKLHNKGTVIWSSEVTKNKSRLKTHNKTAHILAGLLSRCASRSVDQTINLHIECIRTQSRF